MINDLKIRFKFILLRIQEEGFLWSFNNICHRCILFEIYFILLPLILILKINKIKIIPIQTSRIGHLAGEADCFIKLSRLGLIDLEYKYFLLYNKNKICNLILFEYISNNIKVISNKWLVYLLELMVIGPGIRYNIEDYILSIESKSSYYEINKLWNGNDPVFILNNVHLNIGKQTLQKLGVISGKSFVCIHVRSQGYSVKDDKVHSHRNFPHETLILAINEIIAYGDVCILMGDANTAYFPKIKGLIDYAHSVYRSELMDVYLCANTKFFLGNSSGLYLLSSVFNRPCALTNMLPFAITGFSMHDICIPKLIKCTLTGRKLNLSEIMNSNISKYRNAIQFKNSNLELVNNNAEEIRDLVIDMYSLIKDTKQYAFMRKLNSSFLDYLDKSHYCYGTMSNLAPSFINKYKNIFNN